MDRMHILIHKQIKANLRTYAHLKSPSWQHTHSYRENYAGKMLWFHSKSALYILGENILWCKNFVNLAELQKLTWEIWYVCTQYPKGINTIDSTIDSIAQHYSQLKCLSWKLLNQQLFHSSINRKQKEGHPRTLAITFCTIDGTTTGITGVFTISHSSYTLGAIFCQGWVIHANNCTILKVTKYNCVEMNSSAINSIAARLVWLTRFYAMPNTLKCKVLGMFHTHC